MTGSLEAACRHRRGPRGARGGVCETLFGERLDPTPKIAATVLVRVQHDGGQYCSDPSSR